MSNLLDPSILFFVFGAFAGLVRSNLEIPAPVSRFLSLYLLMALGLKGGLALAKSGRLCGLPRNHLIDNGQNMLRAGNKGDPR